MDGGESCVGLLVRPAGRERRELWKLSIHGDQAIALLHHSAESSGLIIVQHSNARRIDADSMPLSSDDERGGGLQYF